VRLIQEKGQLPDTIYYQIDGGSENANSDLLAICELIVARRLAKRVVLTRLPVGHTHEVTYNSQRPFLHLLRLILHTLYILQDIDGRFGVIWKYVRGESLLTPQAQKDAFYAAFKDDAMPTKVEDIFVMPDYSKWLEPYKTSVARYCKEKWTQLQWQFTAVPCSEQFPLGVKTQYRKYASDTAFDIVDKASVNLNRNIMTETRYIPIRVNVRYEPPEGFSILKSFPTGKVPVMPFWDEKAAQRKRRAAPGAAGGGAAQANSRKSPANELLATMAKVRSEFRGHDEDVIEKWEDFCKIFPGTDDAVEYARKHGMRVPLYDYLSGDRRHYRSGEGLGSQRLTEGERLGMGSELFSQDGMLVANAMPSVVVGQRLRGTEGIPPYELLPHSALVDTTFRDVPPPPSGNTTGAAASVSRPARQVNAERPFDHFTVPELKNLLKDMGVTAGLSKLKKEELIARIVEEKAKAAAAAAAAVAPAVAVAAVAAASNAQGEESGAGGEQADSGAEAAVEGDSGGAGASIAEGDDDEEDEEAEDGDIIEDDDGDENEGDEEEVPAESVEDSANSDEDRGGSRKRQRIA
jgi:hypothetical protein